MSSLDNELIECYTKIDNNVTAYQTNYIIAVRSSQKTMNQAAYMSDYVNGSYKQD